MNQRNVGDAADTDGRRQGNLFPKPGRFRRGAALSLIAATAAVAVVALWPSPVTLYAPRADAATPPMDAQRAADLAPKLAKPMNARAALAKPQLTGPPVPETAMLIPGTALPKVLDDDRRKAARRDADTKAPSEKERAMARELAALRQQLADERTKVAALFRAKAPILRVLDEQSRRGVEQAEKVIALTGLDADKLVAQQPRFGEGGLLSVTRGFGLDRFDANAHALARRIQRWRRLQEVLRRLPLEAPLDHYRKSSDFGIRTDPKTHRKRKHNGIDFAYYRGAAVRSTADGTVVFAGRRGGYGNMVEIDHGQGIRTRYGHMKKIMVEKGQKVTFREQIGLVGSTGRSTGPHVHYEVLVHGRAVNPMRFITAGKYAFKPVPDAQVVAVRPEMNRHDATAADPKIDLHPKPRAAASMIDRPDSSTKPGASKDGDRAALRVAAPDAKEADKPDEEARQARLSESLIYPTGILPRLRPRKWSPRKRIRHHRRRHRRHRRRAHR